MLPFRIPALAAVLLALWAFPAFAGALDVGADRLEVDQTSKILSASGNVSFAYEGLSGTADSLVFNALTQKGHLLGHVTLHSLDFNVAAQEAQLDLAANEAILTDFDGHWGAKVRTWGKRLTLGKNNVELDDASLTNCMHPQPDLRLWAKHIRYYPNSKHLNFSAEGATLMILGAPVFQLPYLNTTLGAHPGHGGFHGGMFPSFGFDAYRGLFTGARIDYSLGKNSRGAIPISYSADRGWNGGIEHVLGIGPGELSNAFQFETPWVINRGGYRAKNDYSWSYPNGNHFEVAADYRDDMNGQAVTRLPEVSFFPPHWVNPWLDLSQELRAGYLLEDSSGNRSLRLRWAASASTPHWHPWPVWDSWLALSSSANRYTNSQFGGIQLDWNHHQAPNPDFALDETLELIRFAGNTPFLFDKQYDAERLRLGATKNWGPTFTTGGLVSFSRINDQGAFSMEDLALTLIYRWHCFGVTLGLHPLVLGTDLSVQFLNF